MRAGADMTIKKQCDLLKFVLRQNAELYYVLKEMRNILLPDCYIAGDCIAKTVWNYLYEKQINYGIECIEIDYFDKKEGKEEERKSMERVLKYYDNVILKVYAENVANIQLEYLQKKIAPFKNTEQAIQSFVSTATSIGVAFDGSNFDVYAPFGLNDLFSGIIRPNKSLASKDIYDKKAKEWCETWPELRVISW